MAFRNTDSNFLLNQISIVKYDLYFKFEQEYRKIMNAYHNAFAEAQSDADKSAEWPATYQLFFEQINISLVNWNEYGYKKEIEAVLRSQICYPARLKKIIPSRIVVPASARS